MKNYELVAMTIKCATLFLAFAFGKWLLQFLVNKITGGLSLSNMNETIEIDAAACLNYSFDYKQRHYVEKIPLHDVQLRINEEVNVISFSGKILCYEEKKNGIKANVRTKSKEYLADYFVPSLIETIQNVERGD